MANNMIKLTGCAAIVALAVTAAQAQQATVSTLAADGYEVKGITTFDINPADDRDDESVFVIMQKEAEVYGCALPTANTSFCQKIE